MKRKCFLCVVWLLMVFGTKAQQSNPVAMDTARINALLLEVKATISQDPELGLKKATEVKELAEKSHYPVGVATAAKLMGNATFYLGQPENALLIWQDALKIFEAANDKIGQADLLGNIGVFYFHRGDEIKALDHLLQSLKIAESISHRSGMAAAMNNIGAVYFLKEATYDKALKYYQMALPLCEELGNRSTIGAITLNMGRIYAFRKQQDKALSAFNQALRTYATDSVQLPEVYIALGDLHLNLKEFPKALRNYSLALQIASKTNNQNNIARALMGQAKVYSGEGDYKSAIKYHKAAEKIDTAINAVLEFEGLYQEMAAAYAKMKDYENAYKYQTLLSKVKDTLYNIETDKKLATLQFDFDLQKKQNQINLLTKDKSIKELDLKKQTTFRNALTAVLGLIILVVFILYRSYRSKAKSNVILDRKNMEIERLLLNILPSEVAHELRTTGKATPRNYEIVSVMFTDFRGFTALADKMTPQELVSELGNCFVEFDNIIERNGLEKIKTIGDAYMCAGGIPTPGEKHVFRMVKAGLEIQDFINRYNEKRRQAGLSPWEARIGIHVGPVVAGVVGKKKYAYDIWGTTVNIASRMESNGIPGHVNISSAVYDLIKDEHLCTYRGKIYAKNVGEIDMYLVDRKELNFEEAENFERTTIKNLEDVPAPPELFE